LVSELQQAYDQLGQKEKIKKLQAASFKQQATSNKQQAA
jgi:hypothetical protein